MGRTLRVDPVHRINALPALTRRLCAIAQNADSSLGAMGANLGI
jgi:hypothetical protein